VQGALAELCRRPPCEHCYLTVEPHPGWQEALLAIPDGADADICFKVGNYRLNSTLTLANKGRLKLIGAGLGTRIVVVNSEAALRFENCASVQVRDLHAEGGVVGARRGPSQHLNGALTFSNCAEVDIDSISAACAGGAVRAATCLSAVHDNEATSVRIRHCDLTVGVQQAGILIVNAGRAQVEDNAVRVRRLDQPADPRLLLTNPQARAAFRRLLVSRMHAAPTGQNLAPRGMVLNLPGWDVAFDTNDQFKVVWPAAVAANPPQAPLESQRAVSRYIYSLADRFVSEALQPGAPAAVVARFNLLAALNVQVASQGIVVGGKRARDIRITDNTIDGVLQGVHVGVSSPEAPPENPDRAGRVQIRGNTIGVIIPLARARARHGIFVGNCDSLAVQDNQVRVTRVVKLAGGVEGIIVHGQMGRMVLVRQNELIGCTTGVAFTPVRFTPGQINQWLITDNFAPGSGHAVVITPASVMTQAQHVWPNNLA
jgi:hypothetical protein